MALAEKQEAIDHLKDDMTFLQAQLHGLRQKNGLITNADDFSSKEQFHELEKEYEAFRRFFDDQWKHTKKAIRKKTLWSKTDHIEAEQKKEEEKS